MREVFSTGTDNNVQSINNVLGVVLEYLCMGLPKYVSHANCIVLLNSEQFGNNVKTKLDQRISAFNIKNGLHRLNKTLKIF